jgi:hypothetical protein
MLALGLVSRIVPLADPGVANYRFGAAPASASTSVAAIARAPDASDSP